MAKRVLCFAISVLLLLSPIAPSSLGGPAECGMPAAGVDNWLIASQQEAGLNAEKLCALIDKLDQSPTLNIHGVVVARNGQLAFEHYRPGADMVAGKSIGMVRHDAMTLHDTRSVTKSIVSILLGIALEQKLVESIDEPVMTWFPELAGAVEDKDGILLRHLLTMTSGIAWNEDLPFSNPLNSKIQLDRSAHHARYVLAQSMASEPGKVWTYSGGSTALIAEVIQRASKRSIDEYARIFLFEPLGITTFQWLRTPGGPIATESGLRLRPRDMARIGQLALTGGEAKGRRIVSAAWMEEATRAHMPAEGYAYGYFWWVGSSAIGDRRIAWFEAYGYGAQRVIVVPEMSLVVVMTTGMYGNQTAFPATNELLEKFILPAALPE